MRFHGDRRARGIILILVASLLVCLWQVSRLYARYAVRSVAPTVLAQLEQRLQRKILVERLVTDQPGKLLLQGVRVAQGKSFDSGVFLTARELELSYDPALLAWSSLWSRGQGHTQAGLRVSGLVMNAPNPLPVMLPGGPLLTADGMSADFDLEAVLSGRGNVLSTIHRVTIEHPKGAALRRKDGTWDVAEHLKRTDLGFRGEVVARRSELLLIDMAPGSLPPQRNVVEGDFRLEFAAAPVLRFSGQGRVAGENGGTFEVSGVRDGPTAWSANFRAHTPRMAYWYRYFVEDPKGIEVLSGTADVAGAAWDPQAKPGSKSLFRLDLQIRDGAARIPRILKPFTRFRGRIISEPDALALAGDALVGSTPVKLSGDVLMGTPARAHWSIQSRSVTPQTARELFPDVSLPEALKLGGPVQLTTDLVGEGEVWTARGEAQLPPSRYAEARVGAGRLSFQGRFGAGVTPEVDGGFNFPALTLPQYALQRPAGRFSLRDRVAQVTASFSAWGGKGTARGWVDLASEKPQFYATGRLQDVDLSTLPREQVGETPLAGLGSAEFVASGELNAPRASAFVRGTQVRYGDFAPVEAAGRVHLEGKELVIEQGALRDSRGELEVSGRISEDRQLALQVSGKGLDVAALLPPKKEQPAVSGRLYLTGAVTGTAAAPKFAGKAQVYHFAYDRWRGDYAEGSVTADGSFVQISDLNLLRVPVRLTSERLVLTRKMAPDHWEVEGALQVEGLTVGQALQWAGDQAGLKEWPAAGELPLLALSLSGPVSAPSVEFRARAEEVQVRGFDLRRVEAEGRLEVGRRSLELRRAELSPPEGSVTLAGSVQLPAEGERLAERTQIRLAVELRALGLGPVLARYRTAGEGFGTVEGELSASGQVTGTLAQPEVALNGVRVKDLRLNGIAAAVDPVTVSFREGSAVVRGLHVQAHGGELRTDFAAVRLPEGKEQGLRWISAPVRIERFPVSLALQIMETSPGVTEPQLQWLDAFDRWAAREGQVDAQLAFNGPAASGALTDEQVRRLLAEPAPPLPTGVVTATGLRPAAGLGEPGTLRAEFTGSRGQWEVKSATLQQPGGVQATASGKLARLDTENPTLDFKFAVQGLDLKLSTQLPDPELRGRLQALQPLRGEVELAGTVTGTQKQPSASFTLDVREPVVAGIPLDRATLQGAEFSAAQGRLKIGSAVLARRASPGAPEASVRFSGFLPVSWPELAIPGEAPRDLTVELPKQPLSVLNALAADVEKAAAQFAYDLPEGRERFAHLFGHVLAPDGTIEGRVRLAGTANTPNNSGVLSVASEVVRIRGLAASVKRAGWQLPNWIAGEIAGSEPLETEIRQFRGSVELAGDRLRLAELSGQSSHGGAFRGSGEVVLGRDVNGGPAARLNLSLMVDGVRISEKDAARALGEAYRGTQLKLTLHTVRPAEGSTPAPIRITGDWPNVNLSGGVRVDEASLPLAFDTPSAEPGTPLPENVGLNLVVMPGKNVWLRNPVVRLELQPPTLVAGKMEGALRITNRLSAPVVQGTLRAEHGVFNLPLIRLRNAEGEIRVAYDGRTRAIDAVQPNAISLDLTAETTLRIQRSSAVEAEYYDATFEIRGSPGTGGTAGIRSTGLETGLAIGAEGGLNVTVRTEPPLPSSQIEALIRQQYVAEGFGGSGANVVEALRGQIEQALAVNVASELTGRVEDVVRSALGLSIFSVDFGVTQPLRVRLGKRLFGPVYGTVSQSFGGAEDQVQRRYEVYYRVSPQFRVGYRQEDPLGRKVIFFSGTAAF